MALSVDEVVARRLYARGVRRIYGYPGDGINDVTADLRRLGTIEFIQVRHAAGVARHARDQRAADPHGLLLGCDGHDQDRGHF